MNVVDLVATEHGAIAGVLDRCLATHDESMAHALACEAATRLRAWLRAEQEVLFTAVFVVAPERTLPLSAHRRIGQLADVVMASANRDLAYLRPVLQLQRAATRYAEHQTGAWSACLVRLFSAAELRQLRGAMLLELSADAMERARPVAPRRLGRRPPTLHAVVPHGMVAKTHTAQHR
jgi:hypothetical protein